MFKLIAQLQKPLLQIPSRNYVSKANIIAARQKIVLKDEDLIETFVKGSGPGGQCINKRSSCVDLRHIPTGIRVQCQQSRSLADNRGIARKLLREKLDDLVNGEFSKNSQKAAKIAKQKARKAKRSKEKYGNKLNEDKDLPNSSKSPSTPSISPNPE